MIMQNKKKSTYSVYSQDTNKSGTTLNIYIHTPIYIYK